MSTIDSTRLTEITTLKKGNHRSPDAGLCVLEAVAYVAGEPHSDHPACACPVLTAYAIGINDEMPDDETRTRLLLPYVVRLAGSRADAATEQRRAYIAADFAVRVFAPSALATAGRHTDAERLRALPPIVDATTARAAYAAARAADWTDALRCLDAMLAA